MERDDVLLGGGSPEEVLVSVVRKYGDEIYLDSYRFGNILLDLMGQEKKLLKVISWVLEYGGGERILGMKSLSGAQLELEKRKLVLYVAEESLTDEGLIERGVCLLLAGIGIGVGETISKSEPVSEPVEYRYSGVADMGVGSRCSVLERKLKYVIEGFENCSRTLEKIVSQNNLSDFVIENGVLKKYQGRDSHVVVPDGVTMIWFAAFYNCSGLKSVVIPDGVTVIGLVAFYNCSGLKSVVIPDGVTVIGDFAFYGCSALSDVYFKNRNVEIGPMAFFGCPWQP